MVSVQSAVGQVRPISDLRAETTKQIDARLTRLQQLDASLAADKTMAGSEKATLTAEIHHDVEGLTALRDKVGNETSASALRADHKAMIVDYRVYLVEVPKVELAEKLATDAHRVDELQARIDTKLATTASPSGASDAVGSAKDLADAKLALEDLTKAKKALDGQDKALSALTPSDYAPKMFDKYRDTIALANGDLNAASILTRS